MEITNIYINLNMYIMVILIIIILIILFVFCVGKSQQEGDIFFIIAGISFFTLFFSPLFIFQYCEHYQKTNQYTIHYNQGTLTQTITTQDIVDIIMSKGVYDEPSGKTSTITITLPKEDRNNYDFFYNHVIGMEENTYNQKRKQQEQKQEEQQNELKQKYLNETHQVDMKK